MRLAIECFDDSDEVLGTVLQDGDFWEVYHKGYYIRCVLTLDDALIILKEMEAPSK